MAERYIHGYFAVKAEDMNYKKDVLNTSRAINLPRVVYFRLRDIAETSRLLLVALYALVSFLL